MGGVITAGRARFEIYEPNAYMFNFACTCIHLRGGFGGGWGRRGGAGGGGGGKRKGGLVLCYLMSLRRGPAQIISRVFAVYNLLFRPGLNCAANCRHTSYSPPKCSPGETDILFPKP